MEPPRRPGGGRAPLTPQEKAQLQKKLILLKKEYSRTLHRLQRAERVEKVKNYVRKTVAEQNLLLMEGEAEKDNKESISPVTHKASGEVHFGPCSTVSSTRTTSVTFNPEPELFSQEDPFLQSSSSRYTSKDCGEPCMSLRASVPDKNRTKLSRRKTKVPGEAALALEEREASSVPEIFQRNVVCKPEPTVPSAIGSQSPVFKRRSSSKILETDGRSLTATTGGEGIRDISPAVLQPMCSQETPGESISPGLPHPVLCDLSQESQGASFCHPLEARVLASAEGGCPEIAVSPVDFQKERGKEEAEPVEKEMPCGQVGEKDQVALTDLGATSGLGHPAQQAGERKVQEKMEDSGCPNAGSSSRGRSKAKDFGDQRGAGSPLLEGPTPAAPLKNAMDSCTVVEGLLFPVEYYVRTTRRMSSCQSEVNVEAVIQSQLGRSKRGQRAALGRGKAAGSASFSSPEVTEEKAGPFPACDAMHGATSSPSQSASSSQASGSVSCTSGLAESQGLPRRRGRPSHRATTGGLPRGKNGNCHKEGKAVGGPPRTRGGNWEPKQRGRENLQAESEAIPNSSLPEPALVLSDHGMERSSEQTQLSEEAGDSSQVGPKQDEEAPLPPGFAALALGVHCKEDKASLLRWLPLNLDLQEFCLPEDEFGLLKLEKCKAFPAKPLEAPEAGEFAEGLPCAGVPGLDPALAGRENVRAGPAFAGIGTLGTPPFPPPHLPREGFTSCELLLSPALVSGSCLQGSQLPTLAFPLVGGTPASQLLPPNETLPEAPSVSLSHEIPITANEPGHMKEASSLPGSDLTVLGPHSQEPVSEVLNLEGQGSEPLWHSSGDTPAQIEMMAEEPAKPQEDCQMEEGRLQMSSKLKCISGSSLVDVSTVWWEAASSFTELCLLTASETTISLWRCLDPGCWEISCTWHFTKVPVIQLVHLPGVCSIACVALGSLEMEELWFLVPSSEAGGAKQLLVKAGDLKAVLGLQHRRLVTSCGSLQAQEVEVTSFSEVGRSHRRQTLMSPKETLKAFAEVDGMQEALVAMTTTNCVLIWNMTSGQLLKRISVAGYSYPASICHRAYADSGLLFVVLSHLHANENESHGSPAFQVVALNPKTAKSTGVVVLSLPPGTGGSCSLPQEPCGRTSASRFSLQPRTELSHCHCPHRYMEGEVRGTSAAAVLTSGSIAVWDLFLGQCTAVLPPGSEGNWSLVRWSVTDACLLAGQDNGSLCIYTYTEGLQAV